MVVTASNPKKEKHKIAAPFNNGDIEADSLINGLNDSS